MYRLRFALAIGVGATVAASLFVPAAARAERPSKASSAALTSTIEAVRRATERFKDVNVALKAGYVRDPMDMCMVAPMEGQPRQLGGMGIHFFRPDLLQLTATSPRVAGKGTHTDFTSPGVLVYEPEADGRLSLVAVENLVFVDAWNAEGHKTPPEFAGNQYYRMVDNPETPDVDEAHGFMPHYELHMWLYRDNPNGLFAPFNPDVTCKYHKARSTSTTTMK